jgi:hypothetical protein
MEDPVKICLIPRRLVMTYDNCFYCDESDADWEECFKFFGLKHCDRHKAAAIRDCKAYLHKEKLVNFKHAFAHPILGEFLRALSEKTFPVRRSNGEMQEGWKLQKKSFDGEKLFMCLEGEWMVPVEGVNLITKYTPIENFRTIVSSDLVDKVLFTLIDGIYSKEYEEVCILESIGSQETVPELPGVANILVDGEEHRVLIDRLPNIRIPPNEEGATDPS